MFTETSIRAEISTTSESPEPRPATDKEFSDFLKNVERQAFRIARYKVRREEAAHDIVQDAMIGLMRSRQRNSLPSASLRPMFFTILKYSIFDYFRREKVRKSREVLFSDLSPNTEDSDDFDFLSVYEAKDCATMSESTADKVERSQILEIIEEEVQKLPPKEREAFLMRYEHDRGVNEAALAMGFSGRYIKMLCRAAKNRMSVALESNGTRKPNSDSDRSNQYKHLPFANKKQTYFARKRIPVGDAQRPRRRMLNPEPPPLQRRVSGNAVFVDVNSSLGLGRLALHELKENEIARYRSCSNDVYIGAPAALIAAGIVEEHMLPGQPNRPRTRVTINFTEERPDGAGYLQIAKRTSRHLEVRKGVSEEEVSRRLLERDRMRQTRAEPALRLVVNGASNAEVTA